MDEALGIADGAVSLAGDREAEFEQRLGDCATLAVRVAYGVLRNREDAEEVAQEAFARAYRSFADLRERERFRGWLVRICWRLAIDRVRADKRRRRREDRAAASTPPAPTIEDVAAGRELEARVQEAVAELPPKMRLVVVLAAIEGHDMAEVGRLLGVPEGTVRSRLFRARQLLAERLRGTLKGGRR
jgi:RNA polymerase sigma-70 factor (ECF subfamily)